MVFCVWLLRCLSGVSLDLIGPFQMWSDPFRWKPVVQVVKESN